MYVLNMANDPSARSCTVYIHVQSRATAYISHSYHSNHKILCAKEIVHTVKPLLGQLVYRSLRGQNQCLSSLLGEKTIFVNVSSNFCFW